MIVHGGAPCYLTSRFGMVSQVHDRRDTERCLFICHPLEKMDHRLLIFNGLKHGIHCLSREKIHRLSSLKHAVRRHLIGNPL